MKIKKLVTRGARGVPDGSYSFCRPDGTPHDTVFVTGPVGAGKTSFLELVAAAKESIGAYGRAPDPGAYLRRGAREGWIEATWLLTSDEARRAGLSDPEHTARFDLGGAPAPAPSPRLREVFARCFHAPTHGKFEYFPANRRLSSGPTPAALPPLSESAEAALRLTKDPDKYAYSRAWLFERGRGDAFAAVEAVSASGVLLRGAEPDSLAAVKRSVAALAPHLRLLGVLDRAGKPKVMFRRVEGTEVELDELSDGEHQAVLFAVTFARLGLSSSVVLVDYPELFQSPDRHAPFVSALRSLGTDNQLVLATTSERLLSAAAREQVISLPAPGRAAA